MAHEIDTSRTVSGAAISVLKQMWHRLGVVLDVAPKTVREALELASMDFEVEVVPLFSRVADVSAHANGDGYIYEDVALGRGVIRKDTNRVIGVVGPSYHALQNEDAFGVLQPMLDKGLCTIETAGSLRDGQDVWMLVKFDHKALRDEYERAYKQAAGLDLTGDLPSIDSLDEMLEADEIETYGLITNNHGGKRAVIVRETPIRVVCANTLEFALNKDDGMTVKCRHTESVKENVEAAAADLFAGMAQRYASVAVKRAKLLDLVLTEDQFRKNVLDVAVPVRHLERKIQRREASGHTEAALDRANEKRLTIRDLWENGEGHSGDHSGWDALNGLVQALDHDEKFRNGRSEEKLLQSLYDGTARQIKQKVCNRLLALTPTGETVEVEVDEFGKPIR